MKQKNYVAYLRQSTVKQEVSGLGVEAQREIIQNYLKDKKTIAEYIETESGRKSDRPKLTEALEALNEVRDRVDLPAVSASTKTEFMKLLRHERMVELAFEGHRFWDVRRWKEADKYFVNIEGLQISKTGDNTAYSYSTVVNTRQWDDKMYFFPIPQSERMKNPNLGQNPGW